jgi:signal transduction histidine kinase
VVQLLQLQSEAKEIRIERKTDLSAYAYADKDMINLVVRNLLSNAIKFTPHGGRIVIGTHESESCVEVYVQDSGLGISRYEMEKINQNNYYTTKGTSNETGTGLGLMLCKEFLTKNDGNIMIESEPGHGSTFSFTLPLALNSNPEEEIWRKKNSAEAEN